MFQEVFEWGLLLGRWLHITVAMAWIGTSIFFMWLDRSLEVDPQSKKDGHLGGLWMVHGGGFYHVEKLMMGPTKVPEHLHWFKWESYWTWMSGLFLLIMIFYTGSGTFLLDSSVSNLSYWQAVGVGIGSILVSWFFYDFLWDSKLTKNNPLVGHTLTLLWFAGMSYFLCHMLSGRAAYIHLGALLGTWMTANVFLRIIPRQIKMVEASKKGEPVNQEWGKNAKNRSTHNTYFTLPVIFIMLSNHFPSTYGSNINWLILLLITAAGAAIRHYFVIRLQNPPRSKVFAAVGIAIILSVIMFGGQNTLLSSDSSTSAATSAAHEHPPHSAQATTSTNNAVVKGVVKFEGTVPKGEKLLLPLPCSSHTKDDIYDNNVIVNDGKLQNAVIHIIKGLEGKSFPEVPETPVILDQKNCFYEPRVIGVRVGQKVEFLNSDPLFHNVRAISKHNHEFNEAMPNKDDRMTKVFDKPEFFLQTKCSVHPWMAAYIAVMDNPYFSVTNAQGEFSIPDLPVGSYTLEVWHEVFGTQAKEIVVKENEHLDLEFTFKK